MGVFEVSSRLIDFTNLGMLLNLLQNLIVFNGKITTLSEPCSLLGTYLLRGAIIRQFFGRKI